MKRDKFTGVPDDIREIRHFHLFGAIGGGAKGFNKGRARVGNMVSRSRCIGSIDVDASANRDFLKMTGVAATLLDMFDRDQYKAFHGKEPPAGWREATPEDIRRAAGYEFPHIVFLSAPCKGFSGLLNEKKSKTDKYQALNRLTLRGMFLMLEAFKEDPPEFILFENVPRIATRGRHLLDQIVALLRHYGYAVAETTHDCGVLGGLAQSRKRFLLVARHTAKVPTYLYEPPTRRLQGVGTVLGRMPLPGAEAGGPMHRVPNLQWKTWVRLAFVEAGSDWRSLNKLAVEGGVLRDYLIVPEYRNGFLGVRKWDEHSGAMIGIKSPGQGTFSVADPRAGDIEKTHKNVCRVVDWDQAAGTITSGHGPSSGGQAVADPRPQGSVFGKYAVTPWDTAAGTVISGSTTGQGAFAVADPRTNMNRGKGDNYLTGGHYGVVPWESPSGAVPSSGSYDNGRWSVADPRMPAADQKLVAVIRALDDTWHRPFTTLEMAALQSLIEPEEFLLLDGMSDQAWREHIGNCVPPDAAEAIFSEIARSLLLTWSGETFLLSAAPIWVQPMIVGMCVAQDEAMQEIFG
ncbi:DNA cytosine methyltransferase [Herbaspirillum sp. RV1423]|uniref:DNA cytosine methyltransferase n=1 Tax=Herbaspirillum sp. RV1423 TaxID=1443993 RepID=UPI0004B5F64C|nr:DNA cytosine methyltransferase [Herbaspirillum sp. RV1423]